MPCFAKEPPRDDTEKGKTTSQKIELCIQGKPFKLFKPLLVSMSMFGLVFLRAKKSRLSIATSIYSIFVLFLLLGSFIQLFFAYSNERIGSDSFFIVVVHLYYMHCALNAVVTYKAWNSENRLVEFLLNWSRLLKTNRRSSRDPHVRNLRYEQEMRRRLNLFLTIAWIAVFLNCCCNGYFLFRTDLTNFTVSPMTPTHPLVIPVKLLVTLAQVYASASWIFPLCLFITISEVIYKEFEIFHTDLRKAISEDGDFPDVEYYRCRHHDISQLVETADDILSGFNAAGIVFTICGGMLLLYSVVWNQNTRTDTLVLASHCFWIFLSLVYLVLIGFGGGYLNHMAHAPLKTIHKVKVKDASVQFLLQMNLFLAKLTGESIGLTALGMFVIDKPTILTIAGAFVTYFIVLVQFNQTGPPVCNCTEAIVNSSLRCPADAMFE